MLAAARYLRQWAIGIFIFLTLLFGACDDDNHLVAQIIDDNLESGNNWTFHNVAPAVHEDFFDNTVSASSSHSLTIKSTKAEPSGFSFWRLTWTPQDIRVGSSLDLKVKVKVTDVTGDGAYIALRGDGTSPNIFFETTQKRVAINGNKDFQTYTLKLDSYPEGINQMFIFLIFDGKSTGSVNFDDISLTSHP